MANNCIIVAGGSAAPRDARSHPSSPMIEQLSATSSEIDGNSAAQLPEVVSAAGTATARKLMQALAGSSPTKATHCAPAAIGGSVAPAILVGELVGFDGAGTPCVALAGYAEAVAVRTVVALTRHLVGCQVLVVHESNGAGSPIVTGVIRGADTPPPAPIKDVDGVLPFELEVDGERVVLDARHQLVLRCGEASITLTREGKILLRGTYVSSRSTGVNRIHGGSVEIN